MRLLRGLEWGEDGKIGCGVNDTESETHNDWADRWKLSVLDVQVE